MNMRKNLISLGFALAVFAALGIVAADPPSSLPTTPVDADYDHTPGGPTYWSITLSDVPAGYDVTNMAYDGWCADEGTTIGQGLQTDVMLYSSYELDSGHRLWDPDWPSINYLINNPTSTDMMTMQEAIWDLLEDGEQGGNNGYSPPVGALYAVIVDADNGVERQGTFLEVPVVPVVPLALGGFFACAAPLVLIARKN
jgi:hypothetical protein